ncbi:hypothetical protein FB451DRAFT_1126467 [Mycena latifolia]|nr:hypothetical protein FB451DRAFT_1126467 [Mycena latifolia]
MPPPMPSLEYPLTRVFPGRLFAPVVFAGAFIVLVFLATINAALAGYETITGFDSDFNITQSHWFNKFLPMQTRKAGTLCDPRLLSLGDTVTTNYTLFQYTIASIDTANAGDSGLAYKGWTLDNCDITSLYVNGDANTFVIDSTVIVSCRADDAQIAQGDNYEVTLRTDWPQSTLAGKYGSLLGVQKALKNRGKFNATVDARGKVLDAVTAGGASDFAVRVLDLGTLTNGSFPTVISFQADYPWCPASFGPDAPCALQIPPVNITSMFEFNPGAPKPGIASYFAGDPISAFNQPLVDNNTAGIIANLVQSAYATVRLDLGNRAPNNFLLNTSLIPAAIESSFPQTLAQLPSDSFLYAMLVSDPSYAANQSPAVIAEYNLTGLLPLTLPGPAVVDGVYLCRFQRAKSPGSAFIAVLVATLSMFSSGWALFLGFAAGLVKRRGPDANACADHTYHTVATPGSPRSSPEKDSI